RPLALQRGALAFQRAQRLGAPLQVLLQLADRGALHQQPLAHLLLQRRPTSELGLHRCEIPLGGRALSVGGRVLPLRLHGPHLRMRAILRRLGAPLTRVVQALGRQGQIPFEPVHFHLRVRQAALYLGAPGPGRGPALHPPRPMPAASSNSDRRSSAFSDSRASIILASMTTAASAPSPVPRNRSWMSRSRTGWRLRRYSLWPERESRRVTTTSWKARGSEPSALSNTSETSATLTGRRPV